MGNTPGDWSQEGCSPVERVADSKRRREGGRREGCEEVRVVLRWIGPINASKGIALARTANIRFPAQRTRRQLMYRRFSVTVLFFSA